MEQIIAWDPEYAFMCWGDSLDEITGNSQWQTVSAVKNDHLFLLPAADSNYLPTPLWLLFMAQSMHPDLYEDIDFIGEIKNYYSEFRDFDLTDEQAQYIYERRQPDGSPR